MARINHLSLTLITSALLTACQSNAPDAQGAAFLSQITPHCGKAYTGQIISSDADDDAWRAEDIIMHVRDCTGGEFKIALHVGDNRSRTWILRYEDDPKLGDKLALRHDHRHEDGEPDALTYYGGLAADISTTRISFPADGFTKTLFDRENIPVSKDNIWAMSLSESDKTFTYEMRRPNRDFRIEFDLTAETKTPPTPWGW
jgi:hypothetical protein